VTNVINNTVNHLDRNVGYFSETYRINPNGGGVSLKIATDFNDSFINQFEYTYRPDNPRIYYDISNINGYPFEDWRLYLSPSSASCTSISCDPGVALCPDVSNQPNDDFAVQNCDVSANLTLSLCPFRTSTETVTATVMATDFAGNFVHSTLTTVINPVEPVVT